MPGPFQTAAGLALIRRHERRSAAGRTARPSSWHDGRMDSERHSGPRLRLWRDADLGLLRLINSPEMTEHLGGPETEEQLLARHQRYLLSAADGAFQMFVIELGTPTAPEAAGGIGFWPTTWNGTEVYETGWSVLPAHQGKGVATAAARLVTRQAAARGDREDLHAFPKIDNPASNAICARAGFRLLGEAGFEYPKGHPIRVNDWWLNLAALSPAALGSAPEA